jgi:hypothetical protein
MTPLTDKELARVQRLLQQGEWYEQEYSMKPEPKIGAILVRKIRKQQKEIANINAHRATIKELTCTTDKS